MTSNGDEESRGFKVVDRRPFDAEGKERPEAPEADQSPESPDAAPAPEPVPPGASAHTVDQLDFQSFIKSLLAAGLFQAGVLAEEGKESPPADPVGASQTLGTLLLLREKTQGNLDETEEQLFPDAIGELALAIGLRLMAPTAIKGLGLEEGGSLDVELARSAIDGLGQLLASVREAARPDAVKVLESALTDLRMRFVERAGS